jgi:NADH:ubiquinone reductase (non-electrogenic)
MKSSPAKAGLPRLVVLGSGFAAFSLLRNVDYRRYDITVVSPRNHFLFSPLLPSTTVGTIEFRSIIEPIRSLMNRGHISFYQGVCTAIDPDTQTITGEGVFDNEPFLLNYHRLVISVGAINKTFGVPGVAEHGLFLKELADARAIRQRIIECLERASMPLTDEVERNRLLHFVVVGGGPTGVEFAAELHDFLEQDLRQWFPEQSRQVQITILEASTTLLNSFDASLSAYTMKRFKREKIDVRTGAVVTKVEAGRITLSDHSVVEFGLMVWSTGIGATPLVQQLPFPKDRAQRLQTDEEFSVTPNRTVFAIGDCATRAGDALPATAQVAMQEGVYLAKVLNDLARGRPPRKFNYKHMGMLAYVGDNRALADLPGIKGKGFATWLFWRSAYLTKLVSFKNKVLVLFDWFKTLCFGRDISRF